VILIVLAIIESIIFEFAVFGTAVLPRKYRKRFKDYRTFRDTKYIKPMRAIIPCLILFFCSYIPFLFIKERFFLDIPNIKSFFGYLTLINFSYAIAFMINYFMAIYHFGYEQPFDTYSFRIFVTSAIAVILLLINFSVYYKNVLDNYVEVSCTNEEYKYEMYSSSDRPSMNLMVTNDSKKEYLVVYFIRGIENGERIINKVDLYRGGYEIVLSTESQDKDYMYEYVTTRVFENKDFDPPLQKTEEEHYFKIVLKDNE